MLVIEARRLQQDAREALEQGNYTRATALIGDAELLAEDVHHLVGHIESRELGGLLTLDEYDVRDVALSVPPPPRSLMRLTLPSRSLRAAIGTSLVLSLALTEW